jgi:sec-independent protein translocase protein TatA
MGSVGMPELIIIFVVALIVFGPRKLPELGKSLGKGLAEFRKASHELKSTIEEEVRNIEEERPVTPHNDRQPEASPKLQDGVKSD